MNTKNICIYHYRPKNKFLKLNLCPYCHHYHFIRYGYYRRKPPIYNHWLIKAAGLTAIQPDFAAVLIERYIYIQRYFCKDCHRTFSDKLEHSAYYRWYMLITIVCAVYLHLVKKISIYSIHKNTGISIRTLKQWISKNEYTKQFIGELNRINSTEHQISTLFELHQYPLISEVIKAFAPHSHIGHADEYERLFHVYLIIFSFYHHILAQKQKKAIVV